MPFKDFATEVARNCLASISRTSIVFAWLDDLSTYGSFAELGFAHSLGKPIWLAWPKPLPQLWLIRQMATVTVIAENASLAFRELLFTQLNRSLL
jgi:nucleoside 2-deoxyribosyltransferase